jgi:hypothetical protein
MILTELNGRYLQDSSLSLRQIYVNEGDIYMDSNGTEFSYVTVIDASTSRVECFPVSSMAFQLILTTQLLFIDVDRVWAEG